MTQDEKDAIWAEARLEAIAATKKLSALFDSDDELYFEVLQLLAANFMKPSTATSVDTMTAKVTKDAMFLGLAVDAVVREIKARRAVAEPPAA